MVHDVLLLVSVSMYGVPLGTSCLRHNAKKRIQKGDGKFESAKARSQEVKTRNSKVRRREDKKVKTIRRTSEGE